MASLKLFEINSIWIWTDITKVKNWKKWVLPLGSIIDDPIKSEYTLFENYKTFMRVK